MSSSPKYSPLWTSIIIRGSLPGFDSLCLAPTGTKQLCGIFLQPFDLQRNLCQWYIWGWSAIGQSTKIACRSRLFCQTQQEHFIQPIPTFLWRTSQVNEMAIAYQWNLRWPRYCSFGGSLTPSRWCQSFTPGKYQCSQDITSYEKLSETFSLFKLGSLGRFGYWWRGNFGLWTVFVLLLQSFLPEKWIWINISAGESWIQHRYNSGSSSYGHVFPVLTRKLNHPFSP